MPAAPLSYLHARDLPYPAANAKGHAAMIRRWISLEKVWLRANPGRIEQRLGRDRLRELVVIFRADCAQLDRMMARYLAPREDSFFAEMVEICRPEAAE